MDDQAVGDDATPTGGASGGGAPVPTRSWWRRMRRRHRVALLGGAAVVAAAIVGYALVATHNTGAPADAVRDYVETIAAGDADAANRTVDPASFPDRGADTSLLTDDVLASANRMTVDEVEIRGNDGQSATAPHSAGAVVEVHVDYRVPGASPQRGEATLRARLTHATAGLWEHWTVIDPLVVPVGIESNLAGVQGADGLGGASVGSVRAPTDPPQTDATDRTPVLLYPGMYTVDGVDSPYFTAQRQRLAAVDDSAEPAAHVAARDRNSYPVASLGYTDTPALRSAVADRLRRHLTACAEAVPRVGPECPYELERFSSGDVTLERSPRVESVVPAQSGAGPSFLSLRTDGSGEFAGRLSGGERDRTGFVGTGRVRIDGRGEVSLTLDED